MFNTLETPLKDLRFFNIDDEGNGIGTWFVTIMTPEEMDEAFEKCKEAMRENEDIDALTYIEDNFDCFQFTGERYFNF